MDKRRSKIATIYKEAGFEEAGRTEDFLRFKNAFSVQYVFFFESTSSLSEQWESAHELLTEDYVSFKGPRDLEWNYYGVFLVKEVDLEEEELNILRLTIESNTAYSRKFVFAEKDVSELPPGVIPPQELQSRKMDSSSAIETWEEHLGKSLFNQITDGPKAAIEDRLRKLVRSKINEK